MTWIYGKQDMQNRDRAQENCFLVTNGLGGYASLSQSFSVTRGDQGTLISAEVAPTHRYTLVQRIRESLDMEDKKIFLSTQDFTDKEREEDGYRNLTSFLWDGAPRWIYEAGGLTVTRELYMQPGKNITAILYRVENHSGKEAVLSLEPGFVGRPKGQVEEGTFPYQWDGEKVSLGHEGEKAVYVAANGLLQEIAPEWDDLFYRDDAEEGRNKHGWNLRCLRIEKKIPAGETCMLDLLLSDHKICGDGAWVKKSYLLHREELESRYSFADPMARQLAESTVDYVVHKDSTGGSTIVAGYPFFADWGRDTMISLEGCVLAVNRMETAEEIIETFLNYEQDGLVPNLFPEGEENPRYNTADAALLLINSVWSCYRRTENKDFIIRNYPAMKRIIEGYRRGTKHGIHMEPDGLICAGEGLDQVTWMDVCIDGILPTPRHGKPVEINAYWYNALKIMACLAALVGEEGDCYEELALQVKKSFLDQFWLEEEGYLKDLVSGTESDTQIRCNQIWAVTMPFTMLSGDQERRLAETVYRELYTPCGLRTLSMEDPQFHPLYGGLQKDRDMAYHQGTVWVFPLGAFYRAWLKIHDNSPEAKQWVKERLACLEPMLREGCVGQLPEIYDGAFPGGSRGCFAQAWSVGEILTVYEMLEKGEENV